MAEAYDFHSLEHKWQSRWEREGLYRAVADGRPKFYALEMLPYPSGDLHVGHAKNYTIGDAIARMHRMLGYDVLHPMGWDAFGLPAENAAIARGIHPASWTAENILNMRRQIRLIGTSYDWTREIATCEPEYYRWNQWLFIRLYEAGLAYKREAPVNWCPHDRTVLANEQVVDGRCWRCHHLVERRNLSQWFLRITDYADRLLDDLAKLDGWPERTRVMQRNWIGRSEGLEFAFSVEGLEDKIDVFTTRVDTIYGVTFLAVAPDHPVVAALKCVVGPQHADEIEEFASRLRSKSELERTSLMEKSGIFTGAYAIHPLTRERVPIWVTSYVLAEYGTGAVMGVPAHDDRDLQFAHKYGLPVVAVIDESGRLMASDDFNEMSSERAQRAIAERLTEMGVGRISINYRLRDWLVSRQRYWGTPIPIVYCSTCGEVPVPNEQLPVLLPANARFTGEGSPLAALADFVETTCPRCGEPARRESDTMDTFFDTSWYYLRYLDPHDDALPWERERADRWMNVDQYVGGSEHTVMHLLYSRFFYKFFHDRGWIDGADEPFQHLFHQGMVLHAGEKMSKSRGNVVGIDETAKRHGIDAMRLFLLYVTPPEETSDWNEDGIAGRVRLLNRIWRACAPFFGTPSDTTALPIASSSSGKALLRAVHLAAKSAVDETLSRRFHYNTTIARLDELVNALTASASLSEDADVVGYAAATLPILIAPFAPHLAEELWERSGHTASVHLQPYLQPDESALAVDRITLVVQVNGKVRTRLIVPKDIAEDEAVARAMSDPNVVANLEGKEIRKRIYVPGKLLNLVAA